MKIRSSYSVNNTKSTQCALMRVCVVITIDGIWYMPKYLSQVLRFWFLSPMHAANAQKNLCFNTVSPEPLLLTHLK